MTHLRLAAQITILSGNTFCWSVDHETLRVAKLYECCNICEVYVVKNYLKHMSIKHSVNEGSVVSASGSVTFIVSSNRV